MPAPARFFILLLLATVALRAEESLAHARQAQARLGPDRWSQILRIENGAPHRRYPATFHALVFEFNGLLWFYCDVDGTQSFSLHRNRLAEEKADLAPLLRDIEPGITRWSVVAGAGAARSFAGGPLPNGCFIESIAALREREAAGERPERAQLLSYYIDTPRGRIGHTVMAWESAGAVTLLDPARPRRVFRFPLALAADPLALARAFDGPEVAKARALLVSASELLALGRRQMIAVR